MRLLGSPLCCAWLLGGNLILWGDQVADCRTAGMPWVNTRSGKSEGV